MSVPTS